MSLGAATAFEVRAAGSDVNGGGFDSALGGVDYSQQNAAQFSHAASVSAAGGSTSVSDTTSAGWLANMVGSIVFITGGGATTGWYEIMTITSISGNATFTVDRALNAGAVAGASITLGGAMATLPAAINIAAFSNRVWVKSGTYTNVNSLAAVASNIVVTGYNAARGDNPSGNNRPLIKAGAISQLLCSLGAQTNCRVEFLRFDTNSFATVTCVNSTGLRNTIRNCSAVGTGSGTGFTSVSTMVSCDATNLATGFSGVAAFCFGCDAVGCTNGFTGANCVFCVASGGSVGYGPSTNAFYMGCIAYGTSSSGFVLTTVQNSAANCIAMNCAAFGFQAINNAVLINCAGFNNTSGNTSLTTGATTDGFITLTVDPFINAAGGNFALNNTTGGGAMLRALGLPGSLPGIATTSFLDVGAAQHQDSGGGGLTRVQMEGGVTV